MLFFKANQDLLLLGTYAGELKSYNVQTADEVSAHVCHSSPLTHCEPSRVTNIYSSFNIHKEMSGYIRPQKVNYLF